MSLAGDENKLRLGKDVAFIKSQLRRLEQQDETWEADFWALPKPITQSDMHYVGMVLTQPDGFLRAEFEIDHLPTVNDLATLLAHAMKRPLVEGQLRPRRIHLRGRQARHAGRSDGRSGERVSRVFQAGRYRVTS